MSQKARTHEDPCRQLSDDARQPDTLHELRAEARHGEQHAELEEHEHNRVPRQRPERLHASRSHGRGRTAPRECAVSQPRTFATFCRSSSSLKGFVRYARAPTWMPLTTSAGEERAVKKMIGKLLYFGFALSVAAKVMPSALGIMMSRTMRSGTGGVVRASAARRPSAASRTA